MSNHLAIATVTAALQQILLKPVQDAVTGSNVGLSRPSAAPDDQSGPLVNVYLYQVTPNATFRSMDLPTRRGDGTLVARPLVALDLHYLITFDGKDDALEPQLMLGAVALALQAQPVLSTASIQAATSRYPFLAGSGLESQTERVRFTPTALTLEEFSKLWSAFFQVEYRLSVAYQASVVLIEAEESPQEGLPVQARNLYVMPVQAPAITQVMAAAGAGHPILPSSTLVIQGTHLLSAATSVRIGGVVATPTLVTEKSIRMPVPAGVPGGLVGVQVIQQIEMGTPPSLHPGLESNVAPMILCPVIAVESVSATSITVKIAPMARQGQRLTLVLNASAAPLSPGSPPPSAYSFSVPPLGVDTDTLTFTLAGVVGGGTRYFARVAVDGAESLLNLDPADPKFGPTVSVP